MIKQIPIGPMENFAYLIGDEAAKVCAAIDPAWNAQEIIEAARDSGWKIEKILLTHSHFDHTNALEALANLTGAEIYAHALDAKDLPASLAVEETRDGTEIAVGGIAVRCIHTPGHTPGSQCFFAEGSVVTGDTLFVDNCGRVDLPGSSPADMMASLKRLSSLDPSTVVYPGHDYGPTPTSTIGRQLSNNPYLAEAAENAK
ncbi:MAG TPA: MBL fold metallo-hydrolase [bacterium]|nr:MBL fold metallo-hydrolase [bacterium]